MKNQTVGSAIQMVVDENRRLQSIVNHWQKFAAKISKTLNCTAIDQDILSAAKDMKRENVNLRNRNKPKKIKCYRCNDRKFIIGIDSDRDPASVPCPDCQKRKKL